MSSRSYRALARALIAAAALAVAAGGCGDDRNRQNPAPGTGGQPPAVDPGTTPDHAATPDRETMAAAADTTRGGELTLGGLTFTPPSDWRDLGPSDMRKAQYRLASAAGEATQAEVNVFYFGQGQGGDVQSNLDRWIGQIDTGGVAPQRSTFDVDGMNAHVVSADGAYNPGMGGGMGGAAAEPHPGFRLVGVVVEAPEGNVFFKLTGPAATVREMEDDLTDMVRGARRAGGEGETTHTPSVP